MKLTVEDLKKIMSGVIREFDEKAKKGLSGYEFDEDEPVFPKGYSKSENHDYSRPSAEGTRYRAQGASNMGPYTSEIAVRALAKEAVREHFSVRKVPKGKSSSSAPFNQGRVNVGAKGSVGNVSMPEWKTTSADASPVWEKLSRWYDVKRESAGEKKSKRMRAFESRQLRGVCADRLSERSTQKRASVGMKKLSESICPRNVEQVDPVTAWIERKKK